MSHLTELFPHLWNAYKVHFPRVTVKTEGDQREVACSVVILRWQQSAPWAHSQQVTGRPGMHVRLAEQFTGGSVAGKYSVKNSLFLTLAVVVLDTHLVHDLGYMWNLKMQNS